MHIYPYEDRSREFTRRDESLWRTANKLIGAFHIAGYVTCFVLISIGVNQIQTSAPWLAGSDLRYQEWAAARLINCATEYTWGDAMINGVVSTIDEGIVSLLTAEYYYLVRRCMIVNGLALGVSIINKIFFSSNLYFLKMRYFVFRKDTISMLEVAFLIAAFSTVADQERLRAPLNRHLQYCINGKSFDVQQFIFTTGFNFLALWIVLGVSSAAAVIQTAVFIYHSVTDVPPPPTQPQRFFTGHATTTEPLPDAKVLEPPAEMREILRKKRPHGVRRRAGAAANGASGSGGPAADPTAADDTGAVASPDMVLPAGRSRRRRRAAGSPKRPGDLTDNASARAPSVAPTGSPGHASVTLGGFAVPQTHGLSLQGFDGPASTAFAQSLANAGGDADAEVDAPDELGESTM